MSIATIITIVVGFVGLAIVVWGFRGRRTRGTPRCRCWYDMSGLDTLTCPECGRIARTDRELVRPRRRWVTATAGTIVLVAAGVSAWVIRVGIDAALPNAAHIALYDQRKASEETIIHRMIGARLSAWEWRWLAHRNARLLETESDPTRLVSRNRIAAVMQSTTHRPNVDEYGWDRIDNPCAVDMSETARALEGLLDHPDRRVSNSAWRRLRQIFPSIARSHAGEMLFRRFQESRLHVFGSLQGWGSDVAQVLDVHLGIDFHSKQQHDAAVVAFMNRVRSCNASDTARPTLLEGLDSEHELVRTYSLALLLAYVPDDDDLQQRVLELIDDPSPVVQNVAHQAAFTLPMSPELIIAVKSALQADNPWRPYWAATFVAKRGPAALRERARRVVPLATYLPSWYVDHLSELKRIDPDVVDLDLMIWTSHVTQDAERLISLGVSRADVGHRLLEALAEACPLDDVPLDRELFPHTTWHDYRIEQTLYVLTALEIDRARSLAEAHLAARSARVQLAAGSALLRFGGDVERATSLIVEGSIGTGRSELPDTLPEDLRRRGLALSMVTPLLADPRPEVRLLGVRMLAAAGPDHAGAAEPALRTLLRDSDRYVSTAATQTLNGFILDG